MSRRFPASVYDRGVEPDPRFSLANERTFLAWIRTSLALLGAGVALEALDVPIDEPFRLAASGAFVALGLLGTVQASVGWARTERALRDEDPLPGPSIGLALAAGIVGAVVLLVVGFVR